MSNTRATPPILEEQKISPMAGVISEFYQPNPPPMLDFLNLYRLGYYLPFNFYPYAPLGALMTNQFPLPPTHLNTTPVTLHQTNEPPKQEYATIDNLFNYGAIPVFAEHVESIKDIKFLKKYLKQREKDLLFPDSDAKMKIILQRIAKLLISKFNDSKLSYINWMKALTLALRSEELILIDSIWLMNHAWQENFCRGDMSKMQICFSRFILGLKAHYPPISTMCWANHSGPLSRYILSLTPLEQTNALKNVVFYGKEELINSYLDTVVSFSILKNCLTHANNQQWEKKNIHLLEIRINQLRNQTLPQSNERSPKKIKLSTVDTTTKIDSPRSPTTQSKTEHTEVKQVNNINTKLTAVKGTLFDPTNHNARSKTTPSQKTKKPQSKPSLKPT